MASPAPFVEGKIEYAELCKLLRSEDAAQRQRGHAYLEAGGMPSPLTMGSLEWKSEHGTDSEQRRATDELQSIAARRAVADSNRPGAPPVINRETLWIVFLWFLGAGYVGGAGALIAVGAANDSTAALVVGCVLIAVPLCCCAYALAFKPTFGFAK